MRLPPSVAATVRAAPTVWLHPHCSVVSLNSFVSRYLVCPIHERLLGRDTFRCARILDSSQWLAPTDLAELQRTKLSALFHHATMNTSFYRDRLRRAGVDPAMDDPGAALSSIPPLTKQDIRESAEEMIWRNAPHGVFSSHTGGSTGEPLAFFFDRRRQAYDQAARIRTHRWFGVEMGDRELYLWGSPTENLRTDRLKRWRDSCFNQRLVNAFDMSAATMDRYLDEWDRFRPACLFGYPSSIALLADHARGRAIDLTALRAVFVTGEVCHPHQRETIAAYFGAPVANGYGSREAGFIAHECPEGSMHITSENVIVEVLDEQGGVLPVGETGEIVVTHLDAYAMPMIRYRTGDVGRLKHGRCACGRGLGLMDIVLGRTTDFLYLPDGTVKHALSIIYPLREMPGVRQFHVVQDERYAVTVEIVADDDCGSLSEENVTEHVRRAIGNEVDLRVRFVDFIASTASGKYRYVESRVKRPCVTSCVETLSHV